MINFSSVVLPTLSLYLISDNRKQVNLSSYIFYNFCSIPEMA